MNVFFPNLLFETRLAGTRVRASSDLMRTVDELSPLLGLLAEPGDVVVVRPDGLPSGIPPLLSEVRYITANELPSLMTAEGVDRFQLVPWAQDRVAHDFAAHTMLNDAGLAPVDAVVTVNSRRFSEPFDLLDPPGNALPFESTAGRIVETIGELERLIREMFDAGWMGWMIKSAHSSAGRNRQAGTSADLSSDQRHWVEKTVRRHGCVYLEPQLAVERECGLQFEIVRVPASESAVRFIGCAELLNDDRGCYRGSVVSAEIDPLWQPAIEHGESVCVAAADFGYFGPLGIDCMSFTCPDGCRILRLCHDVNGRTTMGRLSLALGTRLRPGEQGIWWHANEPNSGNDREWSRFLSTLGGTEFVRTERTSPQLTGNRPVRNQSHFVVLTTHADQNLLALSLKRRLRREKDRK